MKKLIIILILSASMVSMGCDSFTEHLKLKKDIKKIKAYKNKLGGDIVSLNDKIKNMKHTVNGGKSKYIITFSYRQTSLDQEFTLKSFDLEVSENEYKKLKKGSVISKNRRGAWTVEIFVKNKRIKR